MPRYELSDGASNKFWEIELSGTSFTTRYGRIGATGQATAKSFPSAAEALREHDKLVAEKLKKGYRAVAAAGAMAATPAPTEKRKRAVTAVSRPASVATRASRAEPTRTSPGPQRYECAEGTSSKFWEIRADGACITTTFGKIGTSGQSATKRFASEADAHRELAKLVAQKLKKGYAPAGAPAGPVSGAVAGGGGNERMRAIWDRIETGLAAHYPTIGKSLRRGASSAAIAKAEKAIGVQFPDDVRESFRIHDGQDEDAYGLVDGWQLLSLSDLLRDWKLWKSLLDGGDFDDHEAAAGKGVKPDWWNVRWIPLTYDGCGNHHCLDLDPAKGGVAGQMIMMWHDDDDRSRVAKSFTEWLEGIAKDVAKGAYEVDE